MATIQYLSDSAAYRVAKNALATMNREYATYLNLGLQLGTDAWQDILTEQLEQDIAELMQDCEVYLYVYSNESWVVDHAQYLTDHRNIVAAVSLGHYNSIKELQQAILTEQNYC